LLPLSGAYRLKDEDKTKQQLLKELAKLRQRIADLEALEIERQRAKELFSTLINSSPIGIYIVQDRKFQFVNPQFQKLTGYSKDELLGMDYSRLVLPEDRENVTQILKGKGASPHEYRFVTKSGESRWVMEMLTFIQYQGKRATLGNFIDITERKRTEEELQYTAERLRKALEGTIQVISLAIERADPYAASHQRRVTTLASAISQEMGLSREQMEGIRMAGLIHDLGKIFILAEVLSKPGRLTEIEFGLIKAHPQVGYEILKTIEFPWPVAQIVLQHHERMDGSGYPAGLSGEEVMLEARILAVADVVEAMLSPRPYRPALSIEKALEEISHNKGVLYDPGVVDACLKLFTEKGFKFE
jgi:PAS domain S-box-containing protein/putative nucleotidyltransferase with HDIG domain